jgi:hypothetical protein
MASFTAPDVAVPTNLGFTLTVEDDGGQLDEDTVLVTIFPAVETCNVATVTSTIASSSELYEACETLIIGPDFLGESGASLMISSGLEVQFLPEFLIEQGATMNVDVCGQSLCQTSDVPMPNGCHSCVVEICDIDSSCCDTAFDQSCVDMVQSVCNLACE